MLPDSSQPQPLPADVPPAPAARIVAVLQILICSEYPTQVAIGGMLTSLGYVAEFPNHALNPTYVVVLSLLDSAALIGLIVLFLRGGRERPFDVIFGRRPIAREVVAGIPLTFVAIGIAVAVLLAVQQFAPSLHTVDQNPLQQMLRSPRDAWLFVLVVIVAGGVREEVQRAFLLHRFERYLGGGRTGVIVTSAAFGAGHLLQGVDAAIAIGLIGALWGFVYLRRRSIVAPMVSHAGFDLLQIAQFLVARG